MKIFLIFISLIVYLEENTFALSTSNDINDEQVENKLTTPLSGDYLVGLNAFNKLTGKNLRYIKNIRTIEKELEVSQSLEKTPSKNRNPIGTSEFYETLLPFPKNLYKQTITEEYYQLSEENGEKYEGALSTNSPKEVFATLTEAISNLNSRGVSGHVRFLLTDTLYPEAGSMTINITGNDTTNASRTLTIKPNTGVSSVTITVNSNSPVFVVYESYIIFDGSNTAGGSSQNLTISNTGSSSSSGVTFVAGVSNITFKNLTAFAKNPFTSYNIVFDNSNSVFVDNCVLKKATIAIQSQSNCNDLNFSNNIIGSSAVDEKIQISGINIISSSNFVIERNIISGLERPYSDTLGTFGSVTGILVGNHVNGINPSNGNIHKNKIYNIKHTGIDDYAYAALGIKLSGLDSNSNITIANNFIADILSDGDAGVFYNPHGIFIDQGGGYKIYNNSIYLTGVVNNTGLWGPAYTGAITIYPGSVVPNNLNIQNNIFINSQTIGYPGSKAYAFYCGVPNTAFSEINYNDYFATGPNAMLGFLINDKSTIAEWKNSTGKDINSVSQIVNFISSTDLHLAGSSIGDGGLTAATISGIAQDIDDENRHPYYTYMGADEVTSSQLALKLYLKVLIEGFYGNGGLNDTIVVYFAKASPPYQKSPDFVGLSSVSGNDFYFPKEAGIDSYYVVVTHRNSIETWSSSPVVFSFPNLNISYDFTDDQSKAYGNNLILRNGKYCIFGGDIFPQDGLIDLSDVITTVNDANNFAFGISLPTDLNGDQSTDLSDVIIVVNNANSFIAVQNP